MNINTFINDSKNFAKIRDAIFDDDCFRTFASALGLPSNKIYSLVKKDDRVWIALQTWTQQTHTIDELRTTLKACGLHSLVADLFGQQQALTRREEFGEFKNWMCNQLTIDNRESILMSMGLPAGECETNARSSNAFIATLGQYSVIDSSNYTLDIAVFRNYPSIVRKYQQFKGASHDMQSSRSQNKSIEHIEDMSSMSVDIPTKSKPQESVVTLGSKRVENLATWIQSASGDPAYTMITALMDRHKVWYELLAHYDLLCSDSVADLVTQLESMRTGQTQKVFALIAQSDLGTKSLADFSTDLKAISTEFPKLIEEINIWDADRAAEAKKVRDDNKRTYELSRGLRKILIDDLHVATPNNVNDIIAKLTGPKIGLRDISKIYLIDKASLISAGFTAFDAAIMAQQFADMSPVPPGPTSAVVRTTVSTTVMSE